MALARDLSRLLRVESLCNEVFMIRFNSLPEEETCKRERIIQCDEPFAYERCHLEQFIIVYFKSGVDEIRLDAPRQVLGREEANVSSVEVIQLLEVNCGGRWSQAVNTEAFHHLVESHHIIFGDAPTHQRDPVIDTFGCVSQTL